MDNLSLQFSSRLKANFTTLVVYNCETCFFVHNCVVTITIMILLKAGTATDTSEIFWHHYSTPAFQQPQNYSNKIMWKSRKGLYLKIEKYFVMESIKIVFHICVHLIKLVTVQNLPLKGSEMESNSLHQQQFEAGF